MYCLNDISIQNIKHLVDILYAVQIPVIYDVSDPLFENDPAPSVCKEDLLKDGITPEKIKYLRDRLDNFKIGLKFYKEWNYLPDEYHLSGADIKLLITICHWYVKIYEQCDFLEFKEKQNLTWEQEQFIKTVTFLESQLEK